jgi:DNA-binding MarR family transcriptional regulator
MKQPYGLLSEIVVLLEAFASEKEGEDFSLEAFILWLNREVLLRAELHTRGQAHPIRADTQITLLLNQLSKHFKLYSKKMLAQTDLVSIDDHIFLAMLNEKKSERKMTLVEANFMEASSGITVINRLLQKGLIEEFEDPDDKRSKRVAITDKGRREYTTSLPHIRKVIALMAGKLSAHKKTQLVSLLDELNDFHAALHKEARKLTLDQLLGK